MDEFSKHIKALRGNDVARRERAALEIRSFLVSIVKGLLGRYAHGRSAIGDVVHDSIIRILKTDTFVETEPGKPWLYSIARSVVSTYLRTRARKRPGVPLSSIDEIAAPAAGGYRRSLDIMVAEDWEAVLEVLDEMPMSWRIALYLKYQEDLSVQQIADELGVGNSTSDRWLRKGLQFLKGRLGGDKG